MMNPFVAFSLAVSIISFVDTVTNLILQSALEDYYEALKRGLKARKIAFDRHRIHDKVTSTEDLSEDDQTAQELCQKFLDLTEELRAILEALCREEEDCRRTPRILPAEMEDGGRTLQRLRVELDTGGLMSKLKAVKNETYDYICSADQGKTVLQTRGSRACASLVRFKPRECNPGTEKSTRKILAREGIWWSHPRF